MYVLILSSDNHLLSILLLLNLLSLLYIQLINAHNDNKSLSSVSHINNKTFNKDPSISSDYCQFNRNAFNTSFQNAQIVITATVQQVTIDPRNYHLQTATVRVKRIVKGRHLIGHSKQLAVYGLGDARYCRSALYERDTKVILLHKQNGLFYLNSSLIPISLDVLDVIDAILRGKRYKKRRRIKQIKCEKERCAYGSKCIPSSGKCECKTICPSKGPTVCGNDNVTYASECHLSVRSCLLTKRGQNEIRVKSIGVCKKRNPCEDLRCGPGEECELQEDKQGYMSAHCICPKECNNYGDSIESIPVCGTDGNDYLSKCHLRLYNCKAKYNITIKYYGKCDPCKDYKCSYGTVCKLDAERRPQCRCSQQCSMENDPVCGTDGNTYENECLMTVSACRADITLQVYSRGRCTDDNPCAKVRCGIEESCYIESDGKAVCTCLTYCPAVMKPVCAMDGKTYENECEMRKAACLGRTRNAVRHVGTCGMGACAGYEGCKLPKVCVVVNNEPKCICEECESELNEVCASDGITYANPCKMRLEACKTGRNIYEKYHGICEGCVNVRCEFYAQCVSDEYGNGICKCPNDCDALQSASSPHSTTKVCATDGLTYDSECAMKQAACKQQKFIVIAFYGACDSCANVVCPYGQLCQDGLCTCPQQCPSSASSQQVCGEDGIVYRSECHLQMAACNLGTPIRMMPLTHCRALRAGDECGCNRVGAYDSSCNAMGECRCRPGVGGLKCDHCVATFWGIHLIAKGALGCRPCGCSVFGSSRLDCEQSTGRCQCKKGSFGLKCDTCNADSIITAIGCVKKDEYKAPKSCSETQCHHGAKCVMDRSGMPDCKCPVDKCPFENIGSVVNMTVCASNGVTYDNFCELNQFACTHQLDLVAVSLGFCNNGDDEVATRYERKKETSRKNKLSKIGDVCVNDSECKIINSVCQFDAQNKSVRKCACRKGFIETSQANRCIQGEYRHQMKSWNFDGNSAIILQKLRIIHNRLSIYIQIQPMKETAVIFYAWQSNSPMTGDFVLLALAESKILLSYSLGDSPITLISSDKLVMRRQYVIEAIFSGERLSLSINSKTPQYNFIPKQFKKKHLNIDSPAYIGYIPNGFVRPLFKQFTNYSGCISNIALDGHLVPSEHLQFIGNIDKCKIDVCEPNPCLNGAKCVKTHSGASRFCECKPQFSGELCENEAGCSEKWCAERCYNNATCDKDDLERGIVVLEGDDVIRLEKVKIDVRRSMDIDIWLKAFDSDGLVFYWAKLKETGNGSNARKQYMKGDFIALLLIASQPHFFWNLGSGIAYVKAPATLSNHRFHSIRFTRNLRNGTIQVDYSPFISHQISLPKNNHLDVFGEDIYIGGVPNDHLIPPVIPEMRKRFKGVIQRISINGQIFNNLFKRVDENSKIQLYSGAPCVKGICGERGFCYARLNEYSCRCAEGLQGTNCEKHVNISDYSKGIFIDGRTHYSYLNRASSSVKGQQSSNYSFWLKTNQSDGLIWWENKGMSLSGDYMAIYLLDGQLSFSINLGNDIRLKIATIHKYINDLNWHHVVFMREKRKVEIWVDEVNEQFLTSPGSTELNTDGIIWLGGRKLLPRQFPYRKSFIGCIRDVFVGNNIRIHLQNDIVSAKTPPICDN